ncbi:MAG TPA: WecB/TagA/CpsF family glycosyltransferase [Jatrophihabitantaceae bacterium]|jgi:N-acetylglucosaminyldiphosphoundecaprenol N-acetyl-beta-D-mannosaminyltransferase
MKQLILGMPIDALTMDDVLDRCRTSLASRERTLVGVVNAAKMVRLRHDAHLRDSLLECDLLLADGQSVVWASRLLRRRVPERVAGIDLFERLLELAARDGWSAYLLGARADVLATLQQRLGERFPALKIAGARDGYFTDADASTVAADITDSGADMLFLGMTSPKKEIFLGDYGETLGVPVLHGVGGSFDILAGITKRAPLLWQRLGLEWLYRVLQEPGRLWRRYFTTNATFIALVLRELVRRQPPYRHSSGE